ncbi:MAG TPA: 2'-deoxycytidine 5'-triphosphate deaminase [Phycisphaerae bacterium]|nr:2'-deoxycytidine 5'-triphosphate deaminase [Phycisphaerae bacterium]
MSIGILSARQMSAMASADENGLHRIASLNQEQDWRFNASSFDLPLGNEYWEMKGSCRTGSRLQVMDIIQKFALDRSPKHMDGEMVLAKSRVYLIKVDCRLNFKGTKIQGKSTARSSIGRLDVLVRLLVNESPEFDKVTGPYGGDLYVEVTPISFDLLVRPGVSLSQLRLFKGSDRLVTLTREELNLEDDYPVVDRSGKELRVEGKEPWETGIPFCLDLLPDSSAGCSGFVARKDSREPIDPSKRDYYAPTDYWEAVEAKDGAIELETDRLYILRSKERLRIPSHLALECQAYTETLGEWRIEYAGFAHPWFGRSRRNGSPLMFEVRGHNVPTILTDGIPLGIVTFKRMAEPAQEPKEQQYELQELKLSSCFKQWSST